MTAVMQQWIWVILVIVNGRYYYVFSFVAIETAGIPQRIRVSSTFVAAAHHVWIGSEVPRFTFIYLNIL